MLTAIASVLPISGIVVLLCLFWVPMDNGLMLSFLLGTAMIIVGMGLFSVGTALSMTQIGTHMGAKLTKSRKLWLILLLSFLMGVAITVAEPDLQVLAANAPGIEKGVLIAAVSVGVGLYLSVSMLRILFRIPLKWLLTGFYAVIFLLAAISDPAFLSVAFDSGGVTTGPMTVPFIIAFGLGVASIRSDADAKADSFGLVALCSIGPVLAVLLLGLAYETVGGASELLVRRFETSLALGRGYLGAIPAYFLEVAAALAPIFLCFLLFQVVSLRLEKRPLHRIVVGLGYTFAGLVLFLTGVNVGFSSLGFELGRALMEGWLRGLSIPLAMVMGWFIINAEPAVHILNKQVEELSAGAISETVMGMALSAAVSLAMGLAMVRVLTGISILWFLLPGYAAALALAFFVPPTFTAIAFDAGGVASGPMTATFMLPLAMGASTALGGNVMTDAFGLVAMVAMMPLITVQVMGAVSKVKSMGEERAQDFVSAYADAETIELWEVT